MATRALLIDRLSTVDSHQLLEGLPDEVVFEIAAKFFPTPPPEPINEVQHERKISEPIDTMPKPVVAKGKRPLNAFMAFRSYYLRLFPNLQQKTASGFLTTLWNKDSSRNNWSLIAKLYSFVRDEVGKPQVSLSEYLNLACPLMQIVHPDVYLQELSWTVESGEDGAKKLVRVPRSTTKEGQTATSTPPNTELGLLVELVRAGYMSDKGFELVESLNSSYSGLMTAQTSERDLETATEETSKPCPVQKSTFNHSFQSFAANSFPSSVSPASHIPHINKFALQASLVDNARRCYPYNSNNSSLSYGELMLRLDAVPESQPYDIDNPWDVDAVLGYQQPEQCSDKSPESSVYDPREDFHYSF